MNQQSLTSRSLFEPAGPVSSMDGAATSISSARERDGVFGVFWELRILLWGMALEALAVVLTYGWYARL